MSDPWGHSRNDPAGDPANRFFNEQWRVYQKVLQENYMGHREIYGVLHDFLIAHYPSPFRMLDLGCGDASFAARVLGDTPIQTYWGVDLSAPALRIAQENLKEVAGEKSFIQQDLFDFVWELDQNKENNFNLIFSSFALHHLHLEQKECLLSRLPQLLQEGGIFLLIDVVRAPGETRESYLQHYLGNVRDSWSLLTPQELEKLEEHIVSSDFPETQETFFALAQQYRYTRVCCLYDSPIDRTQLLCFYV